MKDTQQICELRKGIHRDVAGMLGLDYKPVCCCCPDECPDFCSICDQEQLRLEQQIIDRGLPQVDWQAMLSLRLPPDPAADAPKFYGQFAIAGSQFSDAGRIVFEICMGDELTLLREPDNAYDPNAIRVMFPNSGHAHFLGYIPRTRSRELAALMDSGLGHLLLARVCYVQSDGGYGPIIRFNLFIKQHG